MNGATDVIDVVIPPELCAKCGMKHLVRYSKKRGEFRCYNLSCQKFSWKPKHFINDSTGLDKSSQPAEADAHTSPPSAPPLEGHTGATVGVVVPPTEVSIPPSAPSPTTTPTPPPRLSAGDFL